jgi:hypothetical protein
LRLGKKYSCEMSVVGETCLPLPRRPPAWEMAVFVSQPITAIQNASEIALYEDFFATAIIWSLNEVRMDKTENLECSRTDLTSGALNT